LYLKFDILHETLDILYFQVFSNVGQLLLLRHAGGG